MKHIRWAAFAAILILSATSVGGTIVSAAETGAAMTGPGADAAPQVPVITPDGTVTPDDTVTPEPPVSAPYKNELVTANGHTYYYNKNGKMAANQMVTYKGKTYYFDSDGHMVTSALFTHKGKTYYATANGTFAKKRFVTLNKKRYYFGSDGVRDTGWISHNNHTYYCPVSGAIYKNCWKTIGGNTYYFGPSYYIRKNRWIGSYYVNADGIRVGTKEVKSSSAKKKQLKMKNILQNPELPTGCESVALTMVLKYKKFSLTKTTIADKYLPKSGSGNFVTAFAGNPRSSGGCGIYSPGLTITANKYLKAKKSKLRAYDITGMKLKDLYKYIDSGDPVIVWNSMYMATPVASFSYSALGRNWTFYRYEHCVVLCGYDKKKDRVLINDSLSGLVWRSRKSFESIYNKMGKMAVVIR